MNFQEIAEPHPAEPTSPTLINIKLPASKDTATPVPAAPTAEDKIEEPVLDEDSPVLSSVKDQKAPLRRSSRKKT